MKKEPTVKLMIRVRQSAGAYRYVNPVWLQRGKRRCLRPLFALANGQQNYHPEATYAVRFSEDGKRRYENVGSDPEVALCRLDQKKKALAAKAVGLVVVENGTTLKDTDSRAKASGAWIGIDRTFQSAVKEYVTETKSFKKPKTYLAYRLAVEGFAENCNKQCLEDLDRKDVLAYIARLKETVDSRTISNRILFLKTFFLHFKLSWPLMAKDMPRYTEKMVRTYSEEEIRTIFAVATLEEFELLSFFLCTGGRDQDVQFASWTNIDFATKKFYIEERTDLGYTPKDREEQGIPIPDYLLDLLRARRKRYPNSRLIFPAQGGRPNGHLLRILKRLALRAGLNCGFCTNKRGQRCDTHPVCKRWILHKWRKTFATRHHHEGVPARTIQKWLRHSELETTLRYLECGDDESPATRRTVNSTFANLFSVAPVSP